MHRDFRPCTRRVLDALLGYVHCVLGQCTCLMLGIVVDLAGVSAASAAEVALSWMGCSVPTARPCRRWRFKVRPSLLPVAGVEVLHVRRLAVVVQMLRSAPYLEVAFVDVC